MYLYYDKQLKLRTSIIHGEPVRQGSDLNVYMCLDSDFFDSQYNQGKWVLTVKTTKVDGTLSGDYLPNLGPRLQRFRKVSTNEVTYDLMDNKNYLVASFLRLPEMTEVSGKISIDAFLVKYERKPGTTGDNIDEWEEVERKAFGRADLFVERTVGYGKHQSDCSVTETDLERLERLIAIVDARNIDVDTASQVYTHLDEIWYEDPKEDFVLQNFNDYCFDKQGGFYVFPYGSRIVLYSSEIAKTNELGELIYPKLYNFVNTCPYPYGMDDVSLQCVEIINNFDAYKGEGQVVLRLHFLGSGTPGKQVEDVSYEYVNEWHKIYPFDEEFGHIGTEIEDLKKGKLDKSNNPKTIYATSEDGQKQINIPYSSERINSTIVKKNENGSFEVEQPINDYEVANKKYVDNTDLRMKGYVDAGDEASRRYADQGDQKNKEYVDGWMGMARIGMLSVSDYDDDTGYITYKYDNNVIDHIDDTQLKDDGVLRFYANPTGWQCGEKESRR